MGRQSVSALMSQRQLFLRWCFVVDRRTKRRNILTVGGTSGGLHAWSRTVNSHLHVVCGVSTSLEGNREEFDLYVRILGSLVKTWLCVYYWFVWHLVSFAGVCFTCIEWLAIQVLKARCNPQHNTNKHVCCRLNWYACTPVIFSNTFPSHL